jgi:hypothetical protein
MKSRMMKRHSQLLSSLAGACSVLLVLCAAQPAFGQQSALAKPATAVAAAPAAIRPALQAATEEQEAATPAKPGGEGIKVHGHWKFVVHDADGKLVSTREFDNSLLAPDAGDVILTGLLTGEAVVVDWGVILCPQGGAWNINPNGGEPLVCTVNSATPVASLVPSPNGPMGSYLAGNNDCGSACVANLQIKVNNGASYGSPLSFSLTGSYTATQNVTINAVETMTGFCEMNDTGLPGPLNSAAGFVTISPKTCDTLNYNNEFSGAAELGISQFTGTYLNTAQNPAQSLTAGQVLTVTVTISFS